MEKNLGMPYSIMNWLFQREESIMEDRKITLLKACRDLLKKQVNSHYVLDLLSETVFYDDAECDGSCLLDDIEGELEISR